jgi:NAD(P)H-flavin reductase
VPTRPIHTARLVRSVVLSERAKCKHLEFEVADLPVFDFAAGQFVSMLARREGKLMTRAYSLASAPRGNQFDLCLNRVENGFFSNYLCDMNEGDTIEFHGPHGHFVVREPMRDCLFIATGTGIAPMRGFVEALFGDQPRHQGRDIYLLYGTRHESEIYYRDYFEEVARQNPNFHYVVTLSRGKEDWQGERGYVQEHITEIIGTRPESGKNHFDAYICGLNAMVSAVRQLLAEAGWEKKQIIFERYD